MTRGQSIKEEEEEETTCMLNNESDLDCGQGTVTTTPNSLSRSNTMRRPSTLAKNHKPKDVLVRRRNNSGGVESILLVGKSNNRWTLRRMMRRLCKSHAFKNLQVCNITKEKKKKENLIRYAGNEGFIVIFRSKCYTKDISYE